MIRILHITAVIFLTAQSIYVFLSGRVGAGAWMTYLVTALSALCLNDAKKERFEKPQRILRILMNVFMGAYIVFILVLGISARLMPPSGNEKVIIVLGADLENDLPCLTLRKRLEKASQWAEEHSESIIITSGAKEDDSTVSEALAMKRYMTGLGTDPERIFTEDHAADTEENLLYSLVIMRSLGMDENEPVIIVTNGFHCLRSYYYARMAGFTEIKLLAAGMPASSYVPDTLREVLGYGKLILRYFDIIRLAPSPYEAQ